MAGVNKAVLIGNLGADPEMKYTPAGMAVCSMRLATSETRTTAAGEKETKTEWHRGITFGKLAGVCGQYLTKGRQVYFEGKIQTRSWENKEGKKQYTTEILANQMVMLGSAGGGAQSQEGVAEGCPQEAGIDDVPF